MEKKERIADLLRAQGQSEAANRLLGVARQGRITFGHDVEVCISEVFGLTGLKVGVSWKSLGQVGFQAAHDIAQLLRSAAHLASEIQAIIDAPEEEAVN
ncbi:hypothetical protein LCGC14_1839470 [marine sediment metagenome]|uniref:Uncharacterized protein n=1 Tax=marine sediment metagenome TaxID=412755 RepID=A0A0F9GDT2_9ZZZZ